VRLNELIAAFEKTQQKYRSFGAMDTEPDGVFQGLLRAAVDGKTPNVPRTANAWELYANSMNCDEAAAALEKAARAVVDAIEAVPLKSAEPIRKRIKEYCWRFH
jgi:hypothetical protein